MTGGIHLPEVVGEAVIYFDPTNPDRVAEIMAQTWAKPHSPENIRARRLELISKFSWQRSAQLPAQVYRQVGSGIFRELPAKALKSRLHTNRQRCRPDLPDEPPHAHKLAPGQQRRSVNQACLRQPTIVLSPGRYMSPVNDQ